MSEETMSAKEVMDGMKALNDLMNLFKGSELKLASLLPLFMEAVQGDGRKWLEGIDKVSELDVDDAQGALIVALGIIARIKVKTAGTPAEDVIKELFKPKES